MKKQTGLWTLIALLALNSTFAFADDSQGKRRPIQIDMPLMGATAEVVTHSGTEADILLSWSLSYVQIKGVKGAKAINQRLKDAAEAWQAETQLHARSAAQPGQGQYADYSQAVRFLSPTLICVQAEIEVTLAWQPYPFRHRTGLTFDAKSGKRISPKSFFVGGRPPAALLTLLTTKLANHHRKHSEWLRPLGAQDLTHAVVSRGGMQLFINDFPRMLGDVDAQVSWKELGTLVDRTGHLSAFLDANPEEYLSQLDERVRTALIALDVSERRTLKEGSWSSTTSSEELMEAIGAQPNLKSVHGSLVDVRNDTRAQFPQVDFRALAEREHAALAGAIGSGTRSHETGRVIGGQPIQLLPAGNPEPGLHLAQLLPGMIVGVERRNLGEYHRVSLSNGASGLVSAKSILIETPIYYPSLVSRNDSDELVLTHRDGTEVILPKGGPGQGDPGWVQLQALSLEHGQASPLLTVTGTRHEIGGHSWVTVLSFERNTEQFDPESDFGDDPVGGINGQLDR